MAATTHVAATTSTADVTSYAASAFTPAASDLILAFVVGSDTAATGTMTDTQGLGFTNVATALFNASASKVYCFIANALAAASSITLTFDCTGDTATGALIDILRVSGMTKTGATALKQSAKQENQTTNSSPAPVFGAACTTTNPTYQCLGIEFNPAAMTPPAGWTEAADTGIATPAVGMETSFRDSGFTGSTLTWTDTTGTADWGILAVELDASGGGGGVTVKTLAALGVG